MIQGLMTCVLDRDLYAKIVISTVPNLETLYFIHETVGVNKE